MKARESKAVAKLTATFISHMVQMKEARDASNFQRWNTFISHMVQMKEKI